MLFAQFGPDFWVLISVLACFIFIGVIWNFEAIFSWLFGLFASPLSELYPPESRERSTAFFLGSSDQRVASIRLGRREMLIALEQDLDSIADVDGELAALSALMKEIYGGMTPFAMAYLERKRAKVSELVTALASANIRASKAEDEEARARKGWQNEIDDREGTIEQSIGHHKTLAEQAIQERSVAEAKIVEMQANIDSLKMQINGVRAAMGELKNQVAVKDLQIQRHAQKSDLLMRWFDKMKEAYKQKRIALVGVQFEVAHRRQEVIDAQEDRLRLSELLLSMGQRIVKQAESLAKKAEKPNQGG